MESINDLLIGIKAEQLKSPLNKTLLIQEAFLLWSAIIEGEQCENFTRDELLRILQENVKLFNTHYPQDKDYCFIMGWMGDVAFWIFGNEFSEERGKQLLSYSYKMEPENSLFKWAIRDKLNLSDEEITTLVYQVRANFEKYYNHGLFIKAYFIEVMKPPLAQGY